MATELGYSETVFIDLPEPGSTTAHAHIFTPATETAVRRAPDSGRGLVAARSVGTPVHTLQVPAGIVAVRYHADSTGDLTSVVAAFGVGAGVRRPRGAVGGASLRPPTPTTTPTTSSTTCGPGLDRDRGQIRARMFANELGVPEDEATGAAAVRITDHLSRDLRITQGKGSQIFTTWNPDGWVGVAGRVVSDGVRAA